VDRLTPQRLTASHGTVATVCPGPSARQADCPGHCAPFEQRALRGLVRRRAAGGHEFGAGEDLAAAGFGGEVRLQQRGLADGGEIGVSSWAGIASRCASIVVWPWFQMHPSAHDDFAYGRIDV
jgi:hypothetical protein